MELTIQTDIETIDPGGELRDRFVAFGVQAMKWNNPILELCLKDIDQRIQDGRDISNEPYVREQLVKRHLIEKAMVQE